MRRRPAGSGPWGYVILFLPGFGALAYVLVELLPEWFGSVQGQHARKRVVSTLDPGKRYRLLTDQLEVTDTIANRSALAEECLRSANSTRRCATTSTFCRCRWATTRSMRSARRAPSSASAMRKRRSPRWTIYAHGGLTISRPMAICSMPARSKTAAAPTMRSTEYQAVAGYYAGAEARVRYGLLLDKTGRKAEAKTVLTEVLAQLKRAPKYVRRAQAEWIALAEKALRG